MKPSEYLALVRRRWFIFLLCLVTAVLIGILVFQQSPRRYTAKGQAALIPPRSTTAAEANDAAQLLIAVAPAFADVVRSSVVMVPVTRKLGITERPDVVARDVEVTVPTGTAILNISVTRGESTQASDIANAIMDQLPAIPYTSATIPQPRGSLQMMVLTPATPPAQPAGPNRATYVAVSTFAGLGLGFVAAMARDRLAARPRRTSEDAGEVT